MTRPVLRPRPHLIIFALIVTVLGALAVLPFKVSVLGHQSERKVTGSGVDSMLLEYDFDINPAPGVFSPVAGSNLERAPGAKIKSIQVFDERDNSSFIENCPAPKTCTLVMETSGRDIKVFDDQQGVTIDVDKAAFKQGRTRKWRLSGSIKLRKISIQTSVAQGPVFNRNCAGNKCSVEVIYTF